MQIVRKGDVSIIKEAIPFGSLLWSFLVSDPSAWRVVICGGASRSSIMLLARTMASLNTRSPSE